MVSQCFLLLSHFAHCDLVFHCSISVLHFCSDYFLKKPLRDLVGSYTVCDTSIQNHLEVLMTFYWCFTNIKQQKWKRLTSSYCTKNIQKIQSDCENKVIKRRRWRSTENIRALPTLFVPNSRHHLSEQVKIIGNHTHVSSNVSDAIRDTQVDI